MQVQGQSKPQTSDVYDVELWGYDTGTKVWTTVFGVILAGLIDWCTVAMPVRNHPPHDPSTAGWTFALIIAMVAPTSWLIGRLTKKDWNNLVLWAAAVVGVVVFQLVAMSWAHNYS